MAKKQTWKQLEQHAFVKVIQQIAKALGIRLTKAKLAQVLPLTGAAVGGGFNAYFTAKPRSAKRRASCTGRDSLRGSMAPTSSQQPSNQLETSIPAIPMNSRISRSL